MIGDTCNRHIALVLATKKVANIVRHVHQVLRAAHAPTIGVGTSAHVFPRAARWRAAYPTGGTAAARTIVSGLLLVRGISSSGRAAGCPR
jgi:hypothetical protein